MDTFNCTGQVSTTLKPERMSCRDAGPSMGQFPPNSCCIPPQKTVFTLLHVALDRCPGEKDGHPGGRDGIHGQRW